MKFSRAQHLVEALLDEYYLYFRKYVPAIEEARENILQERKWNIQRKKLASESEGGAGDIGLMHQEEEDEATMRIPEELMLRRVLVATDEEVEKIKRLPLERTAFLSPKPKVPQSPIDSREKDRTASSGLSPPAPIGGGAAAKVSTSPRVPHHELASSEANPKKAKKHSKLKKRKSEKGAKKKTNDEIIENNNNNSNNNNSNHPTVSDNNNSNSGNLPENNSSGGDGCHTSSPSLLGSEEKTKKKKKKKVSKLRKVPSDIELVKKKYTPISHPNSYLSD